MPLPAGTEIQTVRLDKTRFTARAAAEQWCRANKMEGAVVEGHEQWHVDRRPKLDFVEASLKTFSLGDGVTATAGVIATDVIPIECFAPGEWAGLTWDSASLDAMVRNFTMLQRFIKPPLKLGHDESAFNAFADGAPALGWVQGLRRQGDKLIAEVAGMPRQLREIIKTGAYRRVSAEIYPEFEGTSAAKNLPVRAEGNVLAALSLLGASIPEVKTLDDLQKFLATEGHPVTLSESPCPDGAVACVLPVPVTIHALGDVMPEATAAELEKKIAKLTERDTARETELTKLKERDDAREAELLKLKERDQAREAEVTRLKEANEAAARRDAAMQGVLRMTEAERFVADRSSPTCLKLLPAQRAAAIALHAELAAMPDRKVALTEGEGDKRKTSEKTLLELFTQVVEHAPDHKTLLTTLSRDERPSDQPLTFDEAMGQIATRDKLDLSKPADRKIAAIKAGTEFPETRYVRVEPGQSVPGKGH